MWNRLRQLHEGGWHKIYINFNERMSFVVCSNPFIILCSQITSLYSGNYCIDTCKIKSIVLGSLTEKWPDLKFIDREGKMDKLKGEIEKLQDVMIYLNEHNEHIEWETKRLKTEN